MTDNTISFIGGGNMAACIFKSLLDSIAADLITIAEPDASRRSWFTAQGAHATADNLAAARRGSVIFLAVKPQVLGDVLQEFSDNHIDFTDKIVISMAAGCRCDSIIRRLGAVRLIRMMPNTPAQVGLGVTALYCTSGAHPGDCERARALLANLGLLIEVADEEQLNVIGVVGGCAPAFVYRFMEAMIASSIRRGLSAADSRRIAEQVMLGTATLAARHPHEELAALREAVTSRGGTTFEGLKILSAHDFDGLIEQAVEASMVRTAELEKLF